MFTTARVASILTLAYLGIGNADLITVAVGGGGLHFTHPAIVAKPGDTINFSFGNDQGFPGGNYSVTQSADFFHPCLPKKGGFNSGFQSLTQDEYEAGGLHFELLINDTEPIWYYSAVDGDCQNGMVGSINPNLSAGSNETYVDFYTLALHATTVSVPSTTGGGQLVTGTPIAITPASTYPMTTSLSK